jgi:hypothetical protein
MSKIIHDLIKMKYVREGYLPNHPYHLISDDEMCDAFMCLTQDEEDDNGNLTGPHTYKGYFFLMYPLLDVELNSEKSKFEPMIYSNLVKAIHYHINAFKLREYNTAVLPDWVYSYMLGSVVSVLSPILDIHDIIEPLHVDNEDDLFESEQSIACYKVSEEWNRKAIVNEEVRFSPIKLDAQITEFYIHPEWVAPQIEEDVLDYGLYIKYVTDILDDEEGNSIYNPQLINLRPPSPFGEHHVVKYIRIHLLDPMAEVSK